MTVGEQEGTHAGCAVETTITVATPGEDPFVLTVHKAQAEIDRIDLLAALAFGEH